MTMPNTFADAIRAVKTEKAAASGCVPYAISKIMSYQGEYVSPIALNIALREKNKNFDGKGMNTLESLNFMKKTGFKGEKIDFKKDSLKNVSPENPLLVTTKNHALVILKDEGKNYLVIDNKCGGKCRVSKNILKENMIKKVYSVKRVPSK